MRAIIVGCLSLVVVLGRGAEAQAFGGVVSAPPIPLAPAGPTGVVTGTVMAQDTQRPARFAQVQLQSVAQAQASLQGEGGGNSFGSGGGTISVRTDVDGTFEADNVTPGDYYVTATATGYVAERTLLQALLAAGGDAAAQMAALPQVHVSANATSNVTVTMQRGAALAGHVEWEDGSPGSGITMQAVLRATGAALVPGLRGLGGFGTSSSFATTDDKGNFRLSGIAGGDYVLQAMIQPSTQIRTDGRTGQFLSPIRVFAPGVFRRSDATVISVRAGDERDDVRMVVDLRGLHMVSGSVASVNPGQAVVSGRVSLVDAGDSLLNLQASIGSGGTFRLPYVPKGNYTLMISGASTQANGGFRGRGGQGSTTPAVMFQPFSQPLVVGDTDLSGVAVSLTPVKAP